MLDPLTASYNFTRVSVLAPRCSGEACSTGAVWGGGVPGGVYPECVYPGGVQYPVYLPVYTTPCTGQGVHATCRTAAARRKKAGIGLKGEERRRRR